MKTKITNLGISILLLSLLITSCTNENKQDKTTSAKEKETIIELKKDVKLSSNLVCFVNNKFMGIDQIPVQVEGKTYYGCCPDCVGKIKNLREVRYAIDPLTKIEVDKALAYIVLAPQGNNDVLYFESEENYLKFTR